MLLLRNYEAIRGQREQNQILQEPCQHGHPPPNVFAHWMNVYVVEQNNSILRGLLVMKTDGYSDYRFETYVNTDG
jgi:hypothetical protein